MSSNDDERILNEFKNIILPPLVSALEKVSAELAAGPIDNFRIAANFLIQKALEGLMRAAQTQKLNDINDRVRSIATACIIFELNSALPIDHPYITALLDIKKEPGGLHFICLRRKLIPGMHDCLSRNLVPALFVDSREEFESGRVKITDVRFPNADQDLLP